MAKVKDARGEATGAHKFVRDLAERLRTPRLAILGAALIALSAPFANASSAEAASFGFKPGAEGFNFTAEDRDGTPATEAGTHPYALHASVGFAEGPESPGQPGVPFPAADLRDLRFELPPGLIGNPSVVTQCNLAQFNTSRSSLFEESLSGESCPDKSQVGTITMRTALLGGSRRTFGLFNLTPPPGVAAELGAAPFGEPIAFAGQVRNKQGEYGLNLEARNFPQGLAIDGVEVTVWGTPWAVSHDTERGDCLNETEPGFGWGKCSVGPPKTNKPEAFLTLPASCEEPLAFKASADSWQDPGHWVGDSSLSPKPERCDRLHFQTSSFSGPTSNRASTATGFDFDLTVAQEGLIESKEGPTGHEGLAGPQMKDALVSLPESFTINPSMGAGLGVCTPAQFAKETPTSEPGQGCPNSSKIGELRVQSPLVIEEATGFEQLVKGSIYLAQPFHNPFNALIGLYLIARAPNGIFVEVPGELVPDQSTGRLTAHFEGLPQLPYTHLQIHFREGQRAPLATPDACGNYTTGVELTPWLGEAAVEHQDFEFAVSAGASGGPCPTGTTPFEPGAHDGSLNSNSGSYSPYFLHLTRTDTEQEITSYSATLPPGLTAKLTGIPYCPDSAIEAAKRETGTGELEYPHCPAASEIGRTVAGYGLGGVLNYSPGRLYLAGPYRGAPLSIVAIDSALVGPFDLGVVIVRSAIRVNPLTAQVSIDTAGENPLPHIRDGIPLHLRDIRVYISRPNFTLNPTDCSPFTATSTMNGASPPFTAPDATASPSNLFQVSNCTALPFRPKINLKLKGRAHRGAFPALRAEVTERPGDADIAGAVVTLPHAEFLAQGHLENVCGPAQFKAESCPANSIYGHARAETPLLREPLEGPVYLRTAEDPEAHPLPDLVAALRGDGGIAIDVVGHISSHGGGMRATYEGLPDAPASKFVLTLSGGAKGLLENSENPCLHPAAAMAQLSGQNQLGVAMSVPLKAECKRKGKQHPKHGGKHR